MIFSEQTPFHTVFSFSCVYLIPLISDWVDFFATSYAKMCFGISNDDPLLRFRFGHLYRAEIFEKSTQYGLNIHVNRLLLLLHWCDKFLLLTFKRRPRRCTMFTMFLWFWKLFIRYSSFSDFGDSNFNRYRWTKMASSDRFLCDGNLFHPFTSLHFKVTLWCFSN